jgi:Tfp pilus assembly PilM family ATPase/Tfp pilus assembly protein PilN
MFESLFKRDQSDKPSLVVDLDQTTVRVLEVCPSPHGTSVRWGASVLNLQHAKSYRQAAAEALRKLLSTHGITTRRASLVLSGPSTVALPLELPPLPPDEVASAVQWSALRVMPFPLAEAILGHHPLDSKPEGKERTVLMAAVKRSALNESVNIAQDAGLRTVKVSVLPLALGGIIQALPVKPDETTLVLDIRPNLATIIFFRGRTLQLVRTITPETSTGPAEKSDAKEPLPRLVDEIWLSLAYYQERYAGENIERFWLAGSKRDLEQAQPALSAAAGIPVEQVDLSAVLPAGKDGLVPPALAAAAGLLYEPWKIDLLPREFQYRAQTKAIHTGLRAVAIALILGILAWTGIEFMGARYTRQALTEQQAILKRLSPMAEEVHRWEAMSTSALPRLNVYEEPMAYNSRWLGALKTFSAVTPPMVRLTHLESNGAEGIKVKGLVFDDEQASEVSLSDFMARLQESPYFGAVHLKSSQEEPGYPQRTLTFDLSLAWR